MKRTHADGMFSSKEYVESYNRTLAGCRKVFENFLENELNEKLQSGQLDSLLNNPILFDPCEVQNVTKVCSRGMSFDVPNELYASDTRTMGKTLENILESLPEDKRLQLLSKIPGKTPQEQMETFAELCSGKTMGFMSPLEIFNTLLQKGHFSEYYQKEREIEGRINRHYYAATILANHNAFKQVKPPQRPTGKYADSFMSLGQIMYDKIDDEGISIKTLECSGEDDLPEGEEVFSVAQENLSLSGQEEGTLGKRDNRLETGSNASANGDSRIANAKAAKNNIVTIKPRGPEWLGNFRQQEKERYKNPTLPWSYTLEDGSAAVVAPVCKKSGLTTKPREHYLLKTERPSWITILCLVRDAAAKLPNGVGTRADICELLQESQYINENVPEKNINDIVSGALDRLHYEVDPCVRYDSDKKLWIYLHRDRPLDSKLWEENLESNGKV